MVPVGRLAAVCKAFFDLSQFSNRQHPVCKIAPSVGIRRRVREAELVAGDAGRSTSTDKRAKRDTHTS